MDGVSFGLSTSQRNSFKPWLHVQRFRLAVIYEQRVAQICKDCRIRHQRVERTSTTDQKYVFMSNEARDLRQRGNIFFERCRQEWLSFHIMGVLLSGYESPTLYTSIVLKIQELNVPVRTIMILLTIGAVQNSAITRTSP